MIIEPDFPDHWKTQLLVKLTRSPAAPMLVLRFWAFCQQRRTWRFNNLSNDALAAVCRWEGEPAELRRVLIEAGFLDEELDGATTWLVAHDFDTVNSKATSNWVNGLKGGRPAKTHPEPNGNPQGSGMGREGKDRDGSEGLDRIGNTPLPPKRGKKPKAGAILPESQPDPTRARMLALNSIFNRQPTTAWTAGEVEALKACGLLELAELDFVDACAAVTSFYHADIPREMERRFWRRTGLQQLLNGWAGEEDKARLWARERERITAGEAHKLL